MESFFNRGVVKLVGTDRKNRGMIVSDLEGTLTANYSYWMSLNLSLGLTKEEDQSLYDEFMVHHDYIKWMEAVFHRWKIHNMNTPEKLSREAFRTFNNQHLKLKEGARDFVKFCQANYFFYVISGAPKEFCELAQEELGFDAFFSTNTLIFDEKGELAEIEPHKDGFRKDKILLQMAAKLGVDRKNIIAIGDSENDFTMLNTAALGILVGENVLFPSFEQILNPNIKRMKVVDFNQLKQIVAEFSGELAG